MKFSCEKAILLDAVSVCGRAVSSKSTIAALEGLLIRAGEHVTICGYNLKTGIECTIGAKVNEEGAVVLNARIFSDIVRKLPDDVVSFSTDENMMVTIKCAMSEFNLIGIPAQDFPELPKVDASKNIGISNKILKSMISKTIFAVSENENKPIHTGALFEITGDTITMVAVDGYRLALRREKIARTADTEDYRFVVPSDALREIERILDESEDILNIHPDKKHIMFEIDGIVVISRLLEGDFLNYETAIPEKTTMIYKADAKNLVSAVERVSLIISEKLKSPVRCLFETDNVKFSCITAIGKSYDECRLSGGGEPFEIGFNNRYLLDALRACPEGEVVLEMGGSLAPCVIKPSEGDGFLYLVLPVRLRAE